MKITYKVSTSKDGKPKITLTSEGDYLGTIWGRVEGANEDDAFEKEHGIIHISRNNKRIASLWNTERR